MTTKRNKGRREEDSINNKPLVRKMIWTIGTSILTVSILAGSSAVWAFLTLPAQVEKNTKEIAEIKDQGIQLLAAINKQNLINNDMLNALANIAKEATRTNKLLREINATQSQLVSKAVESETKINNLERITFNE